MHANGVLELLDILCPPLAKSSLRLPVPLLSLLCGGVYLVAVSVPHGHTKKANTIPS